MQTTFRFLFLPLQSLLSINRGMRYFTLSVFVALSLSVHAQHRVKNVRQTVVAVEKSITDRYLDSLKIFRARQDSVLMDSVYVPKSAVLSTEEDAPRLFRLFTPLKFYPDLAHRHFSLSPDEMYKSDEMYSVDKAMMNIYVYHPELVTGVFRTDKNEAKKEAVVEKKKIEVTPPANVVVPISGNCRGNSISRRCRTTIRKTGIKAVKATIPYWDAPPFRLTTTTNRRSDGRINWRCNSVSRPAKAILYTM